MKKILLLNLSLSYRRCLAITIPLCFLLAAPHAAAQQARVAPWDTFGATICSTFMYDTNVFRISPLIYPFALTGKPTRSDQIITSTATLSLNKVYSMQRFEVTGSLVDNRY